MTTFGPEDWEHRWAHAAAEHHGLVDRPPSPHLAAELGDLRPGLALDAGCGDGINTAWLAARGWRVTAVDVSATALTIARTRAEAAGAGIAARIDWVMADLRQWTPEPGRYDLVTCLYVHTPQPVEELVRRLATGVSPGGTLFFAGHSPHDPAPGAGTTPAGREVSVDAVAAALDPDRWELVVAEDRPRTHPGAEVDALIRARRRG